MRLYHNPRCTKSRQALQLLKDAGCDPVVIEYLKSPPSRDEIDAICFALDLEPAAILRFGEACAKELGLEPGDVRPRAEWIALLADHPILMERPIAVEGPRAAVGRPPERVLNLIG